MQTICITLRLNGTLVTLSYDTLLVTVVVGVVLLDGTVSQKTTLF